MVLSVPPSPPQPGVSRTVEGGGGDQNQWLNCQQQSLLETGPRLCLQPGGKGVKPRLPESGSSTQVLAAPVELPMSVAPVEPLAQKTKASSPLTKQQSMTQPTSPPSPTSWERTHNRLRRKARRHISPLLKPSLSCHASYDLSVGRSS